MDQPFTVLNNITKTRWRLDVVMRLNIMPKFQQHEELSGQISASGMSLNVVKNFFYNLVVKSRIVLNEK